MFFNYGPAKDVQAVIPTVFEMAGTVEAAVSAGGLSDEETSSSGRQVLRRRARIRRKSRRPHRDVYPA